MSLYAGGAADAFDAARCVQQARAHDQSERAQIYRCTTDGFREIGNLELRGPITMDPFVEKHRVEHHNHAHSLALLEHSRSEGHHKEAMYLDPL